MNDGPTIPDLFTRALAAGPARPLLTYYDDATGERVELSVATTANWVAKTANMLQDSLGVGAGTLVHLSLPPHWAGAVRLLAAWSAGCTITAAADIGQHESAVVVVGPDVLARSRQAAGFGATGGEVVALSFAPSVDVSSKRCPRESSTSTPRCSGTATTFRPGSRQRPGRPRCGAPRAQPRTRTSSAKPGIRWRAANSPPAPGSC
ncbi:MAG: TIGR03089 family protein [Nocardioidaceae bacterium]